MSNFRVCREDTNAIKVTKGLIFAQNFWAHGIIRQIGPHFLLLQGVVSFLEYSEKGRVDLTQCDSTNPIALYFIQFLLFVKYFHLYSPSYPVMQAGTVKCVFYS